MAYANQDLKKEISAKLKEFMPKSIKWTLSIVDHRSVNLNIARMPKALVHEDVKESLSRSGYAQLTGNTRWGYIVEDHNIDGVPKDLQKRIEAALNCRNYDNSNSQVDYFEVGYYVRINLGRYNKPLEMI